MAHNSHDAHQKQTDNRLAHTQEAKESYIRDQYPVEDLDSGMFDPFFKRKRVWLVFAAFILLFCVRYFSNPDVSGDLDSTKVAIGLAIFVCIAFLWLTEAMPLAATALLVPVLAAFFGVFDVRTGLSNFANPLIFIFLGGFALAAALAYQGIDKLIANRIVMASKGSMLVAAIFLFVATAFLSMWMSNTATTAMMIPLILGITSQLSNTDEQARNRTSIFFLLGVAYAASIGGMGSIVGSPPNGIAAKQLGISFGQWLMFGVPAVLILLPLMIGVLLLILRPALSENIQIEKISFSWTLPRKLTIAIFILTAFSWIFSKQLSALVGITSSFDTVVALVAIFLLLFAHVVRWRDIDRGVDWGVLLLFGGGITLSAVLKETGTSLFLAQIFTQTVAGWSIILVIGAVVLFVIFLTELSSNTATAALFVPIFYAVGVEMGIAPSTLVLSIALAASCAFMLPVATPPNAIVFGTGQIPQKTMMRVGFVLNITFIIILTILSNWLFS